MPGVSAADTARPRNSISGLIERVTYFNEENGFAVLRVQVRGHRELVTVVGRLPSVSAGEWIVAEGYWVHDREHGRQLKADLLKCTPPTTAEGMVKYLGSGMVKGIGPIYARKMVDRFGAKVLDIIENASARLEEIEGIGPQRRRRIKQAWIDQRTVREIMLFLHSHGVGTSRAVRIYKTYGDEAIEKVRQNPYILSRDIRGIGFHTADRIAQAVGVPTNSEIRARAGLQHCLLEASGEGHCALPLTALVEAATKLLEVEAERVEGALEASLAAGELIREEMDGRILIFLPYLHAAEVGVVAQLSRLVRGRLTYPSMDVERAIAWCQDRNRIELSESQRSALRLALSRKVLVVTGGPGVGKTTLVNSILRILRAKKVRCVLTAPTGRAARRLAETTGVAAATIHRLLGVRGASGSFAHDSRNPLNCDLLVVDEISMVDVVLMHHLLRAVPDGAGILLVGDADQLPSVGPGRVLRDLMESGVIAVVRLEEVFRQAASSWIISNAHRINQGRMPEAPETGREGDFYFLEREEPDAIAETLIELVCRRIPRKYDLHPARDIQVLCPRHQGSLGARELNRRLQEELNPRNSEPAAVERFGWEFRLHDKVMQTENNYDKEVFNGDHGWISAIDPQESQVTVRFGRREVIYEFGEMDELSPAYAITVHKAQGSEFSVVVLPLAMQQYLLLQRNLLYTAVTRGRNLVVIVGQRKALATAVRNRSTTRRFTALSQRLRQVLEHAQHSSPQSSPS